MSGTCGYSQEHALSVELYGIVKTSNARNNMKDFAEDQIAFNELRNAAYHEAAHKVLYECFGGAGDAVVWKNQSGNSEEATWLGHFQPRTCPETMHAIAKAQGFKAADLPTNWKVLYGMAGLLAETILSGETDDAGVMADVLFCRIWTGEASSSDLALMNAADLDCSSLSYDVVEECVRLLREGWTDVQREAEYLIAASLEVLDCQ
jgi:hypothetical protein